MHPRADGGAYLRGEACAGCGAECEPQRAADYSDGGVLRLEGALQRGGVHHAGGAGLWLRPVVVELLVSLAASDRGGSAAAPQPLSAYLGGCGRDIRPVLRGAVLDSLSLYRRLGAGLFLLGKRHPL